MANAVAEFAGSNLFSPGDLVSLIVDGSPTLVVQSTTEKTVVCAYVDANRQIQFATLAKAGLFMLRKPGEQ